MYNQTIVISQNIAVLKKPVAYRWQIDGKRISESKLTNILSHIITFQALWFPFLYSFSLMWPFLSRFFLLPNKTSFQKISKEVIVLNE